MSVVRRRVGRRKNRAVIRPTKSTLIRARITRAELSRLSPANRLVTK
jgi:hypothetical protein